MSDHTFHAPNSLQETLTLLDQHGEDARLLSGGTALVVMMKQSLVMADHLVSLHRVPGLNYIRQEDDGIHIGALTHHRQVETSELVRDRIPLLAEVYSHVATVRIRNQATVGGGLAHGDPSQDPPPGLMVLDAKVRIVSGSGERTVPIADFFYDYYETTIQPGEILTEVIVPEQPEDAKTAYLRYAPRTVDDYPTISVAALGRVKDGVCQDVRVALGAASSTAIRATDVEKALQDHQGTDEAMRRAAEAVAGQVSPMDDFRGSAEYKRDMAVVFTRRALERVLGPTQ